MLEIIEEDLIHVFEGFSYRNETLKNIRVK